MAASRVTVASVDSKVDELKESIKDIAETVRQDHDALLRIEGRLDKIDTYFRGEIRRLDESVSRWQMARTAFQAALTAALAGIAGWLGSRQ